MFHEEDVLQPVLEVKVARTEAEMIQSIYGKPTSKEIYTPAMALWRFFSLPKVPMKDLCPSQCLDEENRLLERKSGSINAVSLEYPHGILKEFTRIIAVNMQIVQLFST